MRGAYCVVRVIVLCAVLAACSSSKVTSSSRSTVSPVNASPAKMVNAEQLLATTTGTDCKGETGPILVAPGWKVVWQQIFQHPIAQPPITDGSQILLVERTDPDPRTLQDSILAVEPHTGTIQWSFVGTENSSGSGTRKTLGIRSNSHYWLVILQYVEPGAHSMQSEFVIDRQSGETVYTSGKNASSWLTTLAISEDALYDSFSSGQSMFEGPSFRRVDLPTGQTRWMVPWDLRGPRGLFMVNDQLISFYESEVQHYNPIDGKLVRAAELGVDPIYNDILIHGQIAVARQENFSHPGEQGIQTFDLQNFTRKWFTKVSYRYQRASNAFWGEIPSTTVTPDSIYVFNAQDTLLRLDLQTGNTVWAAPSPGPEAMSRPVILNGQVYGLFADGTIRAFSVADGSPVGAIARTPLWYWGGPDETRDFLDLVGGLGVADNTLIVTTGCRNVFALQREP